MAKAAATAEEGERANSSRAMTSSRGRRERDDAAAVSARRGSMLGGVGVVTSSPVLFFFSKIKTKIVQLSLCNNSTPLYCISKVKNIHASGGCLQSALFFGRGCVGDGLCVC